MADRPDTTAQAEQLEAVLKDAGIPAKRFAARETNHSKLDDNLGLRTIRRRRRCSSLWMRR